VKGKSDHMAMSSITLSGILNLWKNRERCNKMLINKIERYTERANLSKVRDAKPRA